MAALNARDAPPTVVAMHLVAHPELIAAWPEPTARDPWRALVSGCLMGEPCGVDGTDYGMGGLLARFAALDTVELVPFCPEAFALGVPRTMPDIHGGDGFDVLDGRARVLDEHGADLTAAMIAGAEAMVARARERDVRLALLTDMSAACGSEVISLGCRFDSPRRYQRGAGVAAAALARAGVAVVSQRDARTLRLLLDRLAPGTAHEDDARDHCETEWVRANLPKARRWPLDRPPPSSKGHALR